MIEQMVLTLADTAPSRKSTLSSRVTLCAWSRDASRNTISQVKC